ncbi:DUF885 domain-containing protein [Gulosibacter hominis]|uniref:DUF885 domain-containing protein n=1 Tax=Gulosibacter hominis TaxID=2770504 RepID=UPI00191A4D41|nr:DUF885 domain-containing protein [Gulosibacter hominis]
MTQPQVGDASEARAATPLDAFCERWVDQLVELYPELRIDLARAGDLAAYADYSPAGIAAERELVARALRELAEVPVQDAVDRVTELELRRDLELKLALIDAGMPYRDVNNIATPAHGIRAIFDLMPQESADDFAVIAERMRRVPEAVSGYLETLREGVRRGHVAAKRQVRELADQTAAYAKLNGPFGELAAAGTSVAPDLADELAAAARDAAEAYGRLSLTLQREIEPAASESDAFGRELYALNSKMFVGAEIDLDETYEWGIAELQRMIAEQREIADSFEPGIAIADLAERLDNDPKYRIESAEKFREWMQVRADQAVADLAGSHFEISDQMRAIRCMIAPTNEGGIYYTGPSEDFSRPGQMWWSVPEGVTSFATWRELTTVYHEGVPGHHLQIATATAQKSSLNTWRRMNWCSGHGEGWALYAERLMDELGYLDDPAYRFGMLDAQRMRAARVVLDIGVHLGKEVPVEFASADERGRVWDYDFALAFMTENMMADPGSIRFEVNRYFGWAGQAPSYKVGQRIWEQLREAAAQRAGANFSLRDWHTRALKLGTVSLDTLREVLAAESN